jgi:osmotically inducible protein OsmC
VSVGSGAFDSAVGRTPTEGRATNAEEMMGAAVASDFVMALDRTLTEAGHEAKHLQASAAVEKRQQASRPVISAIHIEAVADVPGVAANHLETYAHRAQQACALGRALDNTPLHVRVRPARLNGAD